LKATAEELGFVSQPAEKVPADDVASEAFDKAQQPDHSGEAAELASLANSPVDYQNDGPAGRLNSDAVNKKIASFTNGEDLEAWVLENPHLFGQ
jgi:hypothetical protein